MALDTGAITADSDYLPAMLLRKKLDGLNV